MTNRGPGATVASNVTCAVAVVSPVTLIGPNPPASPVEEPSPTVVPGPKFATTAPGSNNVFVPLMVTFTVAGYADGAGVIVVGVTATEAFAGCWRAVAPVPESGIVCPPRLSVKNNEAERAPDLDGTKLTLIGTELPGWTVNDVWLAAKSDFALPLKLRLETAK